MWFCLIGFFFRSFISILTYSSRFIVDCLLISSLFGDMLKWHHWLLCMCHFCFAFLYLGTLFLISLYVIMPLHLSIYLYKWILFFLYQLLITFLINVIFILFIIVMLLYIPFSACIWCWFSSFFSFVWFGLICNFDFGLNICICQCLCANTLATLHSGLEKHWLWRIECSKCYSYDNIINISYFFRHKVSKKIKTILERSNYILS